MYVENVENCTILKNVRYIESSIIYVGNNNQKNKNNAEHLKNTFSKIKSNNSIKNT